MDAESAFAELKSEQLELLIMLARAMLAGHSEEVQRLQDLEIGSAEWDEQISRIRELAPENS